MKKKTSLATLAGLAAATLAFLKFSKDIPADKKPEETGKEACIRWYGSLSWIQYSEKLRMLDVEFEQGRMDRAVYDAKRARLLYCRNQQSVI